MRLVRKNDFLDCVLCGPVKCVGRPVYLKQTAEAIHESFQNGQEKDCERCPCDRTRRRWNPRFKPEVVTSVCVEIRHHHVGRPSGVDGVRLETGGCSGEVTGNGMVRQYINSQDSGTPFAWGRISIPPPLDWSPPARTTQTITSPRDRRGTMGPWIGEQRLWAAESSWRGKRRRLCVVACSLLGWTSGPLREVGHTLKYSFRGLRSHCGARWQSREIQKKKNRRGGFDAAQDSFR